MPLYCAMATSEDRKDYHEGPEAAGRFERTMGRVLTVSKAELDKREAAYQKSRRASKRQARRSK
jgi:hypothetical protein